MHDRPKYWSIVCFASLILDAAKKVDVTFELKLSIIKVKRSLTSVTTMFITDSGILCTSLDFRSQSATFLFTFSKLSPIIVEEQSSVCHFQRKLPPDEIAISVLRFISSGISTSVVPTVVASSIVSFVVISSKSCIE